ncbi:hypothetical protein D3C72_1954460 [compost metagenome]
MVPTYSVSDTRDSTKGSWLAMLGTAPESGWSLPHCAALMTSNWAVPSTTANGPGALASVTRIS